MKPFFGLDLGSNQIRICQVVKQGNEYFLKKLAAETIVNRTPEETVKLLLKQAGIKPGTEVNLALPESEVYTRIIKVPRLSEMELNSAIQFEAEQYIPQNLEEVELFHQVIDLPDLKLINEKTMLVLLVAIPKDKLNKFIDFLDKAELIPRNLETETFSLKRVIADPNRYQLILFFSHKSTEMIVVYKGEVIAVHSFASGGYTLTRELARSFNLSEMQAEQYKQTYGLKEDLLEGKVAAALLPFMNSLIEQIKKIYLYLVDQGINKSPEQIIISGGGALLPGLSGFLAKKLNTEVIIADPFRYFNKDENFKQLITSEVNPQWAVAVGLAVKGL